MSYPSLDLLIDGQWIDGTAAGSRAVLDPATGEVLGELPNAGPQELRRAGAPRRAAFPPGRAWRRLNVAR